MIRNRKYSYIVIMILMICVIALGVAFAAFSTVLTINGGATVSASNWEIVFEGLTNTNTIDIPTITGTASEVTHPTITNNGTSIGDYAVTVKTPGDAVAYDFKIHNKGDYYARITSIDIAPNANEYIIRNGVQPNGGMVVIIGGEKTYAQTYSKINYSLKYTSTNSYVGSTYDDDCLAPSESKNVTLRLQFGSTYDTNPDILPDENIELDDLGITIHYDQVSSCDAPLTNYVYGTSATTSSSTPVGEHVYSATYADGKTAVCIHPDSGEHCFKYNSGVGMQEQLQNYFTETTCGNEGSGMTQHYICHGNEFTCAIGFGGTSCYWNEQTNYTCMATYSVYNGYGTRCNSY